MREYEADAELYVQNSGIILPFVWEIFRNKISFSNNEFVFLYYLIIRYFILYTLYTLLLDIINIKKDHFLKAE